MRSSLASISFWKKMFCSLRVRSWLLSVSSRASVSLILWLVASNLLFKALRSLFSTFLSLM